MHKPFFHIPICSLLVQSARERERVRASEKGSEGERERGKMNVVYIGGRKVEQQKKR